MDGVVRRHPLLPVHCAQFLRSKDKERAPIKRLKILKELLEIGTLRRELLLAWHVVYSRPALGCRHAPPAR